MSEPAILLAIDIGNSNIVLGAFHGADLQTSWRLSTDRKRMADEYRPLIRELLRPHGWDYLSIKAAVFASVVPPVLKELSEAMDKEHIKMIVLTAALDLGVRVRYEPATSVGADRLANAIAVQERYGQPAIIVDLGTATTLDVLDAQGAYIGGAIAPGIEPSLEGLFTNAFQLPRLQLEAPFHAIGKTTVESIRSGTILGWAGLVDGLIERFLSEMEGDAVLIATGGLAPLIAPHCRHQIIVDVDLTLNGLRLAYERTSSRVS